MAPWLLQKPPSAAFFMDSIVKIFVGFDQREAVAYHTFCQSVIDHSSVPVAFIPLAKPLLAGFEGRRDGSNDFIYSRFLVPELCGFSGHAIYADGDMVCRDDIADLWGLRDPYMACQVVKHEYMTKRGWKYLGAKNEDYPRKNWSSLILWNCGHFLNRVLTREFVAEKSGAYLHRFQWLDPERRISAADGTERIGERIGDRLGALPIEWNWLDIEYAENENAKLIHYTLGTPCFAEYSRSPHARWWHESRNRMSEPRGL